MPDTRTSAGKRDTRFAAGTSVIFKDVDGSEQKVTVKRHGRDASGIYTEIKFANGNRIRVHRSMLHPSDPTCDCQNPFQANGGAAGVSMNCPVHNHLNAEPRP